MSSQLLNNFDCKVLRDNRQNPTEGITVFGAAFGSPSYIRTHFISSVSKANHILNLLKEMKAPQLSFQLQRYCASTCRVSHPLRCTPPGLSKNSVSTLDTTSREASMRYTTYLSRYFSRPIFLATSYCYATVLPAALVAAPTRVPHAASTSWRQSRVSANDTRPARLEPYERVPFNSLFSLANIPDCPQRLLEFLCDLISLD